MFQRSAFISCAACQQTDRPTIPSSNGASRAGPTGRNWAVHDRKPKAMGENSGCAKSLLHLPVSKNRTKAMSSLRQITWGGNVYGLTYTSESAGLRNQLIQCRSTLADTQPEVNLSRVSAQSRPRLQARPTLPLQQVQIENAALTSRLVVLRYRPKTKTSIQCAT